MTTTTQQLLDAYTAAELSLLQGGQSVRFGDRFLQYGDLQWIQKERLRLQAQLAREASIAAGGGSRFSQGDFSGCRRGPEGFTY